MTLLLDQGDYVLTSSGQLRSLTGMEEVLQRVLLKLTARRGGFPLLPELGSRLYQLLRHAPSDREALAKQYVLEALSDETQLTVTDVTLHTTDGDARLTVSLTWQDTPLSVQVSITG
jgi:hypothetical protein